MFRIQIYRQIARSAVHVQLSGFLPTMARQARPIYLHHISHWPLAASRQFEKVRPSECGLYSTWIRNVSADEYFNGSEWGSAFCWNYPLRFIVLHSFPPKSAFNLLFPIIRNLCSMPATRTSSHMSYFRPFSSQMALISFSLPIYSWHKHFKKL